MRADPPANRWSRHIPSRDKDVFEVAEPDKRAPFAFAKSARQPRSRGVSLFDRSAMFRSEAYGASAARFCPLGIHDSTGIETAAMHGRELEASRRHCAVDA